MAKPVVAPAPAALEDPLAGLLGYQLRRASQSLMASLTRDLSTLDLSVVEMSVLLVLFAHEGISQSDIGRVLDIRRANMVPLAAKLSARGLTAARSAGGRAVLLTLSERGEQVARSAQRIIARHEERILPGLSAEKRQRLTRTLHAIWAGSEE